MPLKRERMTTLSKCRKCGKIIIYSYNTINGKSSIENIKKEELCVCDEKESVNKPNLSANI
jgi:hypothetical protein